MSTQKHIFKYFMFIMYVSIQLFLFFYIYLLFLIFEFANVLNHIKFVIYLKYKYLSTLRPFANKKHFPQ